MNRRGFIGRLIGGAVAAATVKPASVVAAVSDAFAVDLPLTDALDLREEALSELAQWWMDRQDQWFVEVFMDKDGDDV